MENNSKKNWWKLIDQQSQADQEDPLESQLSEDSATAQSLQEALVLHRQLKELELEEPSMRFSKNIMEKLPQQYKKVTTKPLFKPRQIRWALMGLFVLVVGSLIPAFTSNATIGATEPNQLVSTLMQFSQAMPNNWFMLIAVISIGLVGTFWLDHRLKKRFLSKG